MAGSGAYPYVKNWHTKYQADSVVVIGIHSPWLEPLTLWGNAATAVARSGIKFPVGMDMDRKVYMRYQIEQLPAFILIRPGGDIVFQTSDPAEYRAVEEMIRWTIRDIEPDAILPPSFEPETEKHPPDAKILPPTPRIILGSSSGAIDNLDSTSLGKYKMYTDSRRREKGRVYLHGRWKVDRDAIAYEEGEESYVRVVYSGKDVWVLPGFEPESAVRVYVKQDRAYLKMELRTNDIRADFMGRPYIYMRHAVPMHVVSNPRYGTHEIQLIPVEGDVAFHYIFFEGTAE